MITFLRRFASIVIATSASAELLYNNGLPDHDPLPNGFEMTQWVEADDFTLTTAARVDGIRFHDIEIFGNFSGNVLWRIHENGPDGKPGAVLFSGTATATHQATGFVSPPYTEFLVTFPVEELLLPAGTYWLALHNGPLSSAANQRVYWESTVANTTQESQSDIGPIFAGSWLSNFVGGVVSELSFQTLGAPLPRVTAVERIQGGQAIRFTTAAGYNYRVEYKNNLSDAAWTALPGGELLSGSGNIAEIVDSNAANLPHRFYRVVLL